MAFHELTTNSVKYGALSAPAGGISIEWSANPGLHQRELHLIWREEGGPPVSPPTRKGFGSVLIERAVAVQLDASVVMDFAEAGFRFELTMPLHAHRVVPKYQS
jgi:two-component sensor histidine kinase